MEDYKGNHGYYELENATKYSIAFSSVEDCYYARGAHFGWNKVDPNDNRDYPPRKIDMAKQWPGREVILTDGGHRECNDQSMISAGSTNDLIPVQFQQSSYECDNSCVWLSACLLMHTVDKECS